MGGNVGELPPLPDLRGRVALITGGSRGIGNAIASAYARAGAAVALVARDDAELSEATKKLTATGAKAIGIRGSVADRDFCVAAVSRAERELGKLDALVNAAGIQGPIGPIESLDAAEFRDTLDVNLLGTVWMMQAAIPALRRAGAGAIVNLSGGGATGPRERFAAYAASKVAVVRVTETVALELAPSRIRVFAIAPGAVNTRMTDQVERAGDIAGERALDEVKKQRASGGADPGRAATLAAWLATDAAAHLSGRLISAIWDDWRALIERGRAPDDPNALTLRRC